MYIMIENKWYNKSISMQMKWWNVWWLICVNISVILKVSEESSVLDQIYGGMAQIWQFFSAKNCISVAVLTISSVIVLHTSTIYNTE